MMRCKCIKNFINNNYSLKENSYYFYEHMYRFYIVFSDNVKFIMSEKNFLQHFSDRKRRIKDILESL